MSQINYQGISVLIADDFSSFRNTVNGMLLNLGVSDIDSASNGEEVIDRCDRKSFDVILCDYDLGPGRSGQHVLEELRFRKSITRRNIFIMVSAEASRNIVMSAYDCEPDDYLMKPITGLMLQQRMARLLVQREVLKASYNALDAGDVGKAMDLLIDLSIAENRYSTTAQKILGELFIKQNELQKAEKLYTRALEVRPLDWARLGLAKVKQLKGDLDTAGSWLDRIVSDNPLFLPAYDVLADNWDMKGVHLESLNTLQKAVEVSPMSILRQKRLAIVAEKNGNSALAIEALRKTVRLGRLSCYGELDDQFNFARAVSNAIQNKVDLPNGIAAEALTILHTAQKEMDLTDEEVAQCHMLTGRIHASSGNHSEANASMGEAERYLDEEDVGIDAELDRLELLLSMGQKIQAEDLLKNLQEKYQGDQSALEKIDRFLNEPASAANKELVAKVNREGIDLYSDGEFDTALSCFERARILFPNHVGIQLNIVQSLIGKMRIEPENEFLQNECQSSLDLVHSLVDSDHPQYSRFIRLKRKAKLASSEQI